jgi:pimeloyl-ACP methyl ester carboxylesterase
MGDVMVLLPGITGSVLSKNGEIVWGYSAGSIGKTLLTLGGTMERALALPHDDPDVDDLEDGIVADALMPDLHLLPGVWKIDGYGKIADAISAGFEVTEGKNFFRFPYDWRRHNKVAARKLARDTKRWLASWRESSGHADAKLILICHSMGGLVARYFLECMEGWKNTRALLTFGTPYRGSLNALDGLANGIKTGPLDLSEVSRQFTAIYQLLPIYECYDSGDGKLARVGETTGIPNVEPAKAQAALRFHREIEEAVNLNRGLPQYQRSGYRIYPAVGIAQQTSQSARLAGSQVEMLQTYNGNALTGDGTVPQVSAIPIELSDSPTAMYAATKHGSLQNADAVITNMVGILSGLDLDLGSFRKPKTHVAIEIGDLYLSGQPVVLRARPTRDAALKAVFWRTGDATKSAELALVSAGANWHQAEFIPAAQGGYHVAVSGADVETAQDAFAVLDAGTKTT